jgi:transaldolase/glucose-6-phosphate isomerase
LEEKYDTGQEFFRWELATASAGAVLGINPFNQPDVQLAKDLARSAMESARETSQTKKYSSDSISIEEEKPLATAIKALLAEIMPDDYIALQAYLPATPETTEVLQNVRTELFKRTRRATTLGFGPRFLHSTGQLHKGGPNSVRAVQIIDEPEQELPVPGTDYSFGSLIQAQAAGDYRALRERNRRVIRINMGRNIPDGLQKLEDFITGRG